MYCTCRRKTHESTSQVSRTRFLVELFPPHNVCVFVAPRGAIYLCRRRFFFFPAVSHLSRFLPLCGGTDAGVLARANFSSLSFIFPFFFVSCVVNQSIRESRDLTRKTVDAVRILADMGRINEKEKGMLLADVIR